MGNGKHRETSHVLLGFPNLRQTHSGIPCFEKNRPVGFFPILVDQTSGTRGRCERTRSCSSPTGRSGLPRGRTHDPVWILPSLFDSPLNGNCVFRRLLFGCNRYFGHTQQFNLNTGLLVLHFWSLANGPFKTISQTKHMPIATQGGGGLKRRGKLDVVFPVQSELIDVEHRQLAKAEATTATCNRAQLQSRVAFA